MLKVIGLEGVPRAGKTTFSTRLGSDDLNFFWEQESILENVDMTDRILVRQKFAELEFEKMNRLRTLNKNVVMDRTFFSSLAYTYAKGVVTGDFDDYNFNRNFYLQNKDKIIIPDRLYFFDISPEESIRRRLLSLDRDHSHPFWTNHSFLKAFSDFFKSNDFYELYPRENVFHVDTSLKDIQTTYYTITDELKSLFDLEVASEKGIDPSLKFQK